MAAKHRLPSFHMQRPAGVRTVQIAVGRNHLRLKPQAEFHAALVDAVGNFFKAVGQFVFVEHPVTEGRTVVIALAKPAVIENEKLHALFCRRVCKGKEFLRTKVKIGGFPVVDDDGAFYIAPLSTAKVCPVQVMEGTAHAAKPRFAAYHDKFGSAETAARFKLPVKIVRIDSHLDAAHAPLVHFHLRGKIAAVDEVEAIDLARAFRRPLTQQGNKRILLMAAHAAAAFHPLHSWHKVPQDGMAFTGMGTRKLQEPVAGVRKVKTRAHRLMQLKCLVTA